MTRSKLLTFTAAAALAAGVAVGQAKADLVLPVDATNLVAKWAFDDESDPTADTAPAGLVADDATLGDDPAPDTSNDPDFVCTDGSPAIGSVCHLNFDSSEWARADNSSDLRPTSVTVSAWVRNDRGSATLGSQDARNNYIIAKNLNDGRASYALYTAFDDDDEAGLEFYVSNDSKAFFSANAGHELWDGDWHHVAGVYDTDTDKVRLFVDGLQVGSDENGPTDIAYGTAEANGDVTIGSFGSTSRTTFDWIGDIDDVRIYDSALTADEIAVLATQVGITKELVEATESINVGAAGVIDLMEEWAFKMEVTVEALGPGDLEDLEVKDPLPGDNELGDGTSGIDACPDTDPPLTPSQGDVTTEAKGRTDKCFVFWDVGDIDAHGSATLTIRTSTDENPAEHQEYTSDGPYCINQSAELSGTIVVDGTVAEFSDHKSNGLEIGNVDPGTGLEAQVDENCDGVIESGTALPTTP